MDPRDAAKVTSSTLTGAFREGIAEGMEMAAASEPIHAYRVLYALAGLVLRDKIYTADEVKTMFSDVEEYLEHGIDTSVQILVVPIKDAYPQDSGTPTLPSGANPHS